MKVSTKSLAAAILTIALSGTQLFAKDNSVNTLSDSEWNAIEESVEMEGMLEIEALPAFKSITVQALEMELSSGFQTNLTLNAPFSANEEVGLVILDNEGELVHFASGSFGDLKELKLADYYDWDMTYVIKVYSENAVFETKLQVVYR